MTHFEPYKEIKKVKDMNTSIDELRNTIRSQIIVDFKNFDAFEERTGLPLITLADACLVVDALGPKYTEEVIASYVNLKLSVYKMTFVKEKKEVNDIIAFVIYYVEQIG